MNLTIKIGKGLLKLVLFLLKATVMFFNELDKQSSSRRPICGAMEAITRHQEGRICVEDYVDATKKGL